MRKAVLVMGIIGGLAAGFLGIKWIKDASEMKDIILAFREVGGVDTSEIDGLVTAAYLLLGSMVTGVIGGVLAFKGKGKIAAGLMIAGAVVPLIFAPKAVAFTFLLLLAGLLSLGAKPAPQTEPQKASAAI